MDKYATDLVAFRLAKAKEELSISTICIENTSFSKSMNCSYYAIFHAARALLATETKDFKKHSAVISYFIATYINSQKLSRELGIILRTAERERNKSDYEDFYIVSKEDALTQHQKAEYFISQ